LNQQAYKVRLYPVAKQNLRQLRRDNPRIHREVESVLIDLAFDPYPPQAQELRDNYAGVWRIKIDGWRILYQVDEPDRTVAVINVKRRDRDTYRKLT
jgi:mRNA-degrading endonuclease RelE of RelBE toxin-antitoxin system